MKLPIALATLFLAATTALPAFAATAAPRHAVQIQQDYRSGINAYAATPRAHRQAVYGWGHCVSNSVDSDARSAFPSWDVCGRG
jgi:hypothetical protein